MRLAGKVAAVTGGGSGIGEATCVRLAEEGASVAVLDIDEGAAALTAKLAGDGLALACDVTDSAAVDAALERLEAELGPVDVWVNNAGIAGGEASENTNPRAEAQLAELAETGEIKTPLEGLVRMSDADWRRMLSVHLDGTFYGTRAAARSMAARETGAIVNVASICGIEGFGGQGRDPRLHPHRCQGADPAERPRQRGRAGLRRHPAGRRFTLAAADRDGPDADPSGPPRPPRGDRRDDRLPRRRRLELLRRRHPQPQRGLRNQLS
jgi:NAD(P)-dependent dehydrogenase (short-subunit alcohol dehydrogenase family)